MVGGLFPQTLICASVSRQMFQEDTTIPLTPDNSATLDDVNLMASAIMEHVSENERIQALKIEDLEATVVALRQLVQKLVKQRSVTGDR